ncbi:MAG: S-layer homology domain-containing protein [Lachnospiraceae bacterium]|nr:S-layer homology domain-containing protein [Lachnospiraceae bacterium]
MTWYRADYYGITGGYSDNTFRPAGKCSRGQMVSFLFRYVIHN